jgi:arginine deiminase
MQTIHVSSEIGTLRRIMIHSPDGGIGKVIPDKAQAWLYDDIVDLEKMRQEYDHYVKLLLYFLDPDKAYELKAAQDQMPVGKRSNLYRPDKPEYFNSDKVIDVQYILSCLLDNEYARMRLVWAVCGIERCSHIDTETLLRLPSKELSKTLISGIITDEDRYVFPPIPNLIFTRDTAVIVNDHLLITRPATAARYRESVIITHLAYYFFFGHDEGKSWNKIIEITDEEDFFLLDEEMKANRIVTIEGGDVMMIAPRHLMVGFSERTSAHAINQLINKLFDRSLVDTISVIKIPRKRDYMHIDTIFTMVKRNVWVLYGPLSARELGSRYMRYYINDILDPDDKAIGETLEIFQYDRHQSDYRMRYDEHNPQPRYLEDLFTQICRRDFGCNDPMQFIYSGGDKFPYNEREQWTDSCNLLALKEGVVIGYDRNHKTAEAFENELGFNVVHARELLAAFEAEVTTPDQIKDTLILLPSGELSRARGGSHCMSMPLLRDEVK